MGGAGVREATSLNLSVVNLMGWCGFRCLTEKRLMKRGESEEKVKERLF